MELSQSDINRIADAVAIRLLSTPLLTKVAAAEKLGVHPRTVQRMIKDGRIKTDQSGKIPIQEIVRILNT